MNDLDQIVYSKLDFLSLLSMCEMRHLGSSEKKRHKKVLKNPFFAASYVA